MNYNHHFNTLLWEAQALASMGYEEQELVDYFDFEEVLSADDIALISRLATS